MQPDWPMQDYKLMHLLHTGQDEIVSCHADGIPAGPLNDKPCLLKIAQTDYASFADELA